MDRRSVLTLDELLQTLQERGIPLPYEIGTFLTLQACERILRAPVVVDAARVWVGEDGEVGVAATGAASEADAAGSVVDLLSGLLIRSAQGIPPMLMELVEHGSERGELTLPALRDDLEAALVPLNRGATTRILVRLLREARRSDGGRVTQGELGQPDELHLSGELDRLLATGGGEAQTGGGASQGGDVDASGGGAGDLDAIIYTAPAPPAAAASAQPALRLEDDYGRIRERSRAMAVGMYASATGLAATVALLWYVIR